MIATIVSLSVDALTTNIADTTTGAAKKNIATLSMPGPEMGRPCHLSTPLNRIQSGSAQRATIIATGAKGSSATFKSTLSGNMTVVKYKSNIIPPGIIPTASILFCRTMGMTINSHGNDTYSTAPLSTTASKFSRTPIAISATRPTIITKLNVIQGNSWPPPFWRTASMNADTGNSGATRVTKILSYSPST